jgi:hypothetical protein
MKSAKHLPLIFPHRIEDTAPSQKTIKLCSQVESPQNQKQDQGMKVFHVQRLKTYQTAVFHIFFTVTCHPRLI